MSQKMNINCHAFSLESSIEKLPYKENVLIIDSQENAPLLGFKHLKYDYI